MSEGEPGRIIHGFVKLCSYIFFDSGDDCARFPYYLRVNEIPYTVGGLWFGVFIVGYVS